MTVRVRLRKTAKWGGAAACALALTALFVSAQRAILFGPPGSWAIVLAPTLWITGYAWRADARGRRWWRAHFCECGFRLNGLTRWQCPNCGRALIT